MVDERKDLIARLNCYVVEYEELKKLEKDLYELKKPLEPIAPSKREPSIKAKDPIKLNKRAFIKGVFLYVIEVALALFLIFCLLNGSNKELGFMGTLLVMGGTPISIALMIFFGIKIKKSDDISSYLAAKKENEKVLQYNKEHKKEIKEAFEAETLRYSIALKEYEQKKSE